MGFLQSGWGPGTLAKIVAQLGLVGSRHSSIRISELVLTNLAHAFLLLLIRGNNTLRSRRCCCAPDLKFCFGQIYPGFPCIHPCRCRQLCANRRPPFLIWVGCLNLGLGQVSHLQASSGIVDCVSVFPS